MQEFLDSSPTFIHDSALNDACMIGECLQMVQQ